ncbi:porin [Endozoicomonas sp. Mp262]|uniref:porin n=1 Tax=Endozoicomonas sp. Mp262 TaxID=2919499 RepID=UPI0021DA3B21
MQKKLLATVVASLVAGQAMALEVVNDGTNKLTIGGRIGIQTETKDGKTSADNDSARINFGFEHKLSETMTGFAKAEWGYKAHNEYTSENGETKADDLFSNRLGYVGLKHSQYGAVAAGKQWSVYSDVANWTDEFAIGGGAAMGQYNGFTDDGGFSGTGRADNAFTYRGEFAGLKVGAQYQLRGESYKKDDSNVADTADNIKRKHGYQLAASYTLDMGLSFGGTYSETSFERGLANEQSSNLKSKAAVAAVKYDMNDIYVAATYGQFRNHTSAHLGKNAATSDGNMGLDQKSEGIELYGRYKLSQVLDGGISLQAGWNQLKVKDDNRGNSSDAKIDKMMLGAIYEVGPMQFAAEYTWDKSKSFDKVENGKNVYKDADNYFNLQARYYF